VHLCFWRPIPYPWPALASARPARPWPRFPPPEHRAALVDAVLIALVRVVRSVYSQIASLRCLAVVAGIRCTRIQMVVSYEFGRVVKISVFMMPSVIFSVVKISFVR
jgi:hypothetical protein